MASISHTLNYAYKHTHVVSEMGDKWRSQCICVSECEECALVRWLRDGVTECCASLCVELVCVCVCEMCMSGGPWSFYCVGNIIVIIISIYLLYDVASIDDDNHKHISQVANYECVYLILIQRTRWSMHRGWKLL